MAAFAEGAAWPPLGTGDGPGFACFSGDAWPDHDAIVGAAHAAFMAARIMLVAAESCTAGLVTASLADWPGASDYLYGGWVVYSNHAKFNFLDVNPWDIEEEGAVSRRVVDALLDGIFDHSPADIAVAVSGVAGPGGGTARKPVGTVWCGAACRAGTRRVRGFALSGDRAAIRRQAVEIVLLQAMEILDAESSALTARKS